MSDENLVNEVMVGLYNRWPLMAKKHPRKRKALKNIEFAQWVLMKHAKTMSFSLFDDENEYLELEDMTTASGVMTKNFRKSFERNIINTGLVDGIFPFLLHKNVRLLGPEKKALANKLLNDHQVAWDKYEKSKEAIKGEFIKIRDKLMDEDLDSEK
jgi:hypothetical protein